MTLICLSISHHNTPVEIRETLSLSGEQVETAVHNTPLREGEYNSFHELLVLSTCNRLEIYAVLLSDDPDDDHTDLLYQYLKQALGIAVERIKPYMKLLHEEDAVRHLFQVTAGLDSLAIGESQILGQVSSALDDALRYKGARHVLPSLFRTAIHAGKRVQSETEIGRHPISVISLAIQLVEQTLGHLNGQHFLLIGAGNMGELAIKSLAEHGAHNLSITNRTYQRALDLVDQYGGRALPFEDLNSALIDADIVLTSTAACQPILTRPLLEEVHTHRSDRPLLLIDLAVPRNIETSAATIPGIQLFDMDGLQNFTATITSEDQRILAQAKAIVDYEVGEYEKLLRVIPLIGELHKKVEEIRQAEVNKVLKKLPDSDTQVIEQIELFSHSLVRKILHEPTMHLRAETNQEAINTFTSTLTRLFDLHDCGQGFTNHERN